MAPRRKLYDPAAYHTATMAEDVRALIDHLGIGRADVMGYSMGARIAAYLALAHPERVRSLILGGLGIIWSRASACRRRSREAMEAPSLADVTDAQGPHVPRLRRADQVRPAALAACIRGSRQTLTRGRGGAHRVPVLVAVGTNDPIAGSAQELAALIPDARGARHSRPRPQARGRRQGVQGGRAGVPGRRGLTPRSRHRPFIKSLDRAPSHHGGRLAAAPFVLEQPREEPDRRETTMAQQQIKRSTCSTRSTRSGRASARRRRRGATEPELGDLHLFGSILHHDTLEQAVVHRVAERLDHADVSGELIRQAYADALEDEPAIGERFRADIVATCRPRSRRPTASSSRCSTSRASTPSRPTGWRTGCGARAARISPITCRAAPRPRSSPTSIRPRASAAASSSTTPPASWSARPR